MLHGIRATSSAGATLNWAPAEFLAKHKVAPWSDMPTWLPGQGETAGFGSRDISRALAAGLSFRPLSTTAIDTLEWFKALPAERQSKLGAGLMPEREAEVLAAWREVKPSGSR
jgi:2'-hydroxyisoflavone reductase